MSDTTPTTAVKSSSQCTYVDKQGRQCCDPVEIGNCCYWHDNSQKKSESNVVSRLEARAKTGIPMVGFCLRGADLRGINLVNHGVKGGYQLHDSDLYRADLRKAHLFHLDLCGSSLMKADLSLANLNCANLTDTNLLGSILEGTRLDNVHWDLQVRQERLAYQQESGSEEQIDLFEQAEEVYRNLRRTNEFQGLFESAGSFFKREMTMQRYQLPKSSFKRAMSKLVDLFCGYGEEPVRVVLFSLIIIFTFAFMYAFMGLSDGDKVYSILSMHAPADMFAHFFRALYFSVVTFTTLGYGDLSPVGVTRFFAAIEAFVGSFTLALFVVVFVKKMTR